MTTTDQDTQPMTLGELDTADWHDDWPTEKITRTGQPRTGAHRRTAYASMLGWALLTVLAGLALGGGAWFALIANSNLAPTSTTTVGTNPTAPVAQGGLIVIPTTTASSTGTHTDARKAVATQAPTAPATTPHSQQPPPVHQAPTTVRQTQAPHPVRTVPDPNNPYCSTVEYSDGTSIAVCSPSPSTPSPTITPSP